MLIILRRRKRRALFYHSYEYMYSTSKTVDVAWQTIETIRGEEKKKREKKRQ